MIFFEIGQLWAFFGKKPIFAHKTEFDRGGDDVGENAGIRGSESLIEVRLLGN